MSVTGCVSQNINRLGISIGINVAVTQTDLFRPAGLISDRSFIRTASPSPGPPVPDPAVSQSRGSDSFKTRTCNSQVSFLGLGYGAEMWNKLLRGSLDVFRALFRRD